VILPIFAWLADLYGRKPMLVGGSAVLTLGAIPFFHLMHSDNAYQIFLGECGFVVGVGMLSAGVAAGNVELMPSAIRCTGLAFAYNASIGLMGGTTPLISAWLIAETANPISPGYWVAAASLVSLFTAVFLVPETRNQSLA